jgi:hypothetical protein
MGLRTGLSGCGKCQPPRNSIPGEDLLTMTKLNIFSPSCTTQTVIGAQIYYNLIKLTYLSFNLLQVLICRDVLTTLSCSVVC